MSTRVTAAAQFVVEDGISVSCAARVLQVSRQSVYVRLRPMSPAGGDADGLVVDRAAGRRARRLHLVAPVLPDDWQTMDLGPERCDVEVAVHVLARRHPAAGYRKITARARRAGYVLNRKKTARLLKAWGFLRTGRKPHPKAQGKPFDITASNQLWQTDMTSIWCGEDGWGYVTAVIDTYDRVLLGGRSPCAAAPWTSHRAWRWRGRPRSPTASTPPPTTAGRPSWSGMTMARSSPRTTTATSLRR